MKCKECKVQHSKIYDLCKKCYKRAYLRTHRGRLIHEVLYVIRRLDKRHILLNINALTTGETRSMIYDYFINHPDWTKAYKVWVDNDYNNGYKPRLSYDGNKKEITLNDIMVKTKNDNYKLVKDANGVINRKKSKKCCSLCNKWKYFSEYGYHVKSRFKLNPECKECVSRNNLKRNRTPIGKLNQIYYQQLENSRKRNHPLPEYDMKWLISKYIDDPQYNRLYNEWVDSDYDRWKAPSIDRIDSNLPYTKDNIQLMTWKENNDKEHERQRRPVNQYTSDGEFVKQFESVRSAKKHLNISNGYLHNKITKNRPYKGFIYKYEDDN